MGANFGKKERIYNDTSVIPHEKIPKKDIQMVSHEESHNKLMEEKHKA
jgi:hypothetical protein